MTFKYVKYYSPRIICSLVPFAIICYMKVGPDHILSKAHIGPVQCVLNAMKRDHRKELEKLKNNQEQNEH